MKTEEVVKILEDNKITNVNPPSTIQSKLKVYINLLNEMDDYDGPLYVVDGVWEEVCDSSGKIQVEGVRGPRLSITDVASSSFYI